MESLAKRNFAIGVDGYHACTARMTHGDCQES